MILIIGKNFNKLDKLPFDKNYTTYVKLCNENWKLLSTKIKCYELLMAICIKSNWKESWYIILNSTHHVPYTIDPFSASLS